MKINIKIINELLLLEMIVVLVPQVFIGYLASGSNNIILFLYASFMIIIVDFIGNIVNHYADWELDEENNKRLELHEAFSKKSLLIISFFLMIILFLMMLINIYLIIITLIGFGCAIFYSLIFQLKDKFFVNSLTLGIAYAFVPYSTGYFVANTKLEQFFELFWIPIYLVVLMMVISMIKDYEDEKGDRKFNKKTLVTVFGKQKALIIQSLSLITLYCFLIIWNMLLSKFIILLLLIPFMMFLFIFYKMNQAETSEECHKVHMKTHVVVLISYIVLIPYFYL